MRFLLGVVVGVAVWNLESGELYRDIYFSTALNANSVEWLSDGYVLLGGQKLVDLERRIVLWQYQHDAGNGFSKAYGVLGGIFWYALGGQNRAERTLFRAKLPHAPALKKAEALNADQLLAVKPGIQLSLNVNLPASPGDQQSVMQALAAQLKAMGMNVVAGSPITLQAGAETGQSRQVSYHRFGFAGGIEQASVTEQVSRLKLIENGKVIWEAVSVTGAPHMLEMKEG